MGMRSENVLLVQTALWSTPRPLQVDFCAVSHTTGMGFMSGPHWAGPAALRLQWALHIGPNIGIKFKNCSFSSSVPRQHSSLTYPPTLPAPLLPCLFRAVCLSENTLQRFYRTKLYRLWSQTILPLGLDSASYIVCLIVSTH